MSLKDKTFPLLWFPPTTNPNKVILAYGTFKLHRILPCRMLVWFDLNSCPQLIEQLWNFPIPNFFPVSRFEPWTSRWASRLGWWTIDQIIAHPLENVPVVELWTTDWLELSLSPASSVILLDIGNIIQEHWTSCSQKQIVKFYLPFSDCFAEC